MSPSAEPDARFARLDAPLDPKRIKSRPAVGNGPALSYIETHDAIRTANSIFGFGKWGHRVIDLNYLGLVPVKNRDGKEGVHVGYLCRVEVTVEGCEVTSGVGYGDATEYRQTAHVTAHELAAKEAESDALKRALKNYGDQFGLALYDKDARAAGHIGSAGTTSAPPAGGGTAGAPAETPLPPRQQTSSGVSAAASRAMDSQPQPSSEGIPDGHVRAADVEVTAVAPNNDKYQGKRVSEMKPGQLKWITGQWAPEGKEPYQAKNAAQRLVVAAASAFLADKAATVPAVAYDVDEDVPF